MKIQDFIKNTLRYSIPTIVSSVVSIAIIPIITRLYPTDEYGKVSLFYSVGAMLASVFTLGLTSACIRFFYEPLEGSNKQESFNYAFLTGATITVIMSVVSFTLLRKPVTQYLFGEDNAKSLVLFFLYIISTAAYKMQSNYARLSHLVFQFNVLQVIYILVNKVFFVLAVIYSTNYFYSIALMTIGLMVETLTIGRKNLKLDFSLPNRFARKQMIAFSLPLLPNDIAVMLNNSAAKFILSYFGDFSAVGVISMATNIANTFNIISNAFAVYWSSFMYENYIREQEMIKKIHNAMELMSVFMVVAIYAFQDVLYLILGGNYRSSQPYFLLIMLMPIQLLICETTSYGINISKKTYINMFVSLASCFVNILISFFLYPQLGILAMAWGIGISAIVQLCLKTIIAQKYYRSIVQPWQTMTGIILICSLCISNLLLFEHLVIRLAISVCVIFISCLIYKKEFIWVINLARSIFQKRINTKN